MKATAPADGSTTDARDAGADADATTGGTPDASDGASPSAEDGASPGAGNAAGPDAGDAGAADASSSVAVGPATALVFTKQPTTVAVGAQEPLIQVTVVDAAGHTVPTPSKNVVLSIGNNPGSSSFLGKQSAVSAAGVASFPTLGLTAPGNGYILVASATGLTPATSSPFNVTPALLPFSLLGVGGYGGNITSVAVGPATTGTPVLGPTGYALTPTGVFASLDNGGSWSAANFGTAVAFGLPVAAGKLVADPKNLAVVYLDASQGLLKTTNFGTYWLPIGAGDTACFVLDPATPQNLYTGTQRSTDGGSTWTPHGFAYKCLGLAIDPTTSALYAVAADPTSGARLGLYKSVDAATTWAPTSNPAPDASPVDSFNVFATASTLFVGAGASLRRSTDGGSTWAPVAAFTAAAVAGAPSNPMRVYASSNDVLTGPVYTSNDGGATFGAPVSVGGSAAMGGGMVASLAVDPTDADHVYAATPQGVFASIDGGATWSPDSTGMPSPQAVNSVVANPTNPNLAVVGIQGAVVRTADGGQTWARASLPGGNVTLNLDPATPNTMYACSGPTLYVSSDGGVTWGSPITTGVGCRSPLLVRGPTLMMPANFDVAFSGIPVSTNSGATWAVTPTTLSSLLFATAFDPAGNNVYVGTDTGTYKSTNGGATWTSMVAADEVFSMLVDPVTPTTLYAGMGYGATANHASGSGGVKRSTDSGATWSAAIGGGGLVATAMMGLPSGTIFAYASGLLGTGGGLWESTDHGSTWSGLTLPSPTGAASVINGLAVSNDGLTIYAATPTGLYKSTSGGM